MSRRKVNAVADLRDGFYLLSVDDSRIRTMPLTPSETERFIREILGRDEL